MNGTIQRFDARAWVLFAIMAVVWGVPYLFIMVAVDSYSPAAVVAGRTLIIKDHARNGVLAQQRISFIDWAANAPYGVPCLYRYNSVEEWRASHAKHDLSIAAERTTINLYPPVVNLMFGRGLQYFAALETRAAQERHA